MTTPTTADGLAVPLVLILLAVGILVSFVKTARGS